MSRQIYRIQNSTAILCAIIGLLFAACEPKKEAGEYTTDASAKDTTLAGQDNDQNGVRDDIDAFIKTNYGDATPKAKAVLANAKISQSLVTETSASKERIYEIITNSHAAINCLEDAFGAAWLEVGNRLEARTLNNLSRNRAYWASMNKMAGMAVGDQACNVALQ